MPEYRLDPTSDGRVTVLRDGRPLLITAAPSGSAAAHLRLATRIAGLLQQHDAALAAVLPHHSDTPFAATIIRPRLPVGPCDRDAGVRPTRPPADLHREPLPVRVAGLLDRAVRLPGHRPEDAA